MDNSLQPTEQLFLDLLHDHRFLTTHQLARLARHQFGNRRSAKRQTLRHLDSLHDRKLVTALERRVGGWQGGSAVTIWTLTTKGLRLLTGKRTGRIRPHHFSTTFLEHLLAVAEVRVSLEETTCQTPGLEVSLQTEPGCWRTYLDGAGMTATLKPDLALRVTTTDFVDHYLIEVDRATENPGRVIRKCWQYETYRRTGAEQKQIGVFPLVVWVVPNLGRAQQLSQAISVEPKLPSQLFTVVTHEQLASLIRDGPSPP